MLLIFYYGNNLVVFIYQYWYLLWQLYVILIFCLFALNHGIWIYFTFCCNFSLLWYMYIIIFMNKFHMRLSIECNLYKSCGAGSAYPFGAPEIIPGLWLGPNCLVFTSLRYVMWTDFVSIHWLFFLAHLA